MGNMYSEEMVEFLKKNSLYKEYNPKAYIRKMVLQKELGYIDESIKTTMSVKPSEKSIKEHKGMKFSIEPSYGVVVCIRNTNEDYLRQMIESVLSQTYEKLTLYIVDYSDRAHAYIANVCTDYDDTRVVYRKLKDGQSVCWDYFVCDYIVFMNEVDALSPIALTECTKAIEQTNADLLYADSAVFKKKKYNVSKCILKPDYAPEDLDTYNYIGDFWVVKRLNIDMSSEFALNSQSGASYELLKSMTEFSKQIFHINKVLYLENILKNYKLKINKCGKMPDDKPLVSIIIRSADDIEALSRVVNSILMMTTYQNYEIIIVESSVGGSKNALVYRYYKLLPGIKNVRFLRWTGEENVSKIYNYAATKVSGDYIVFIDDFMEISSYEWLEEMLWCASKPRTGLVSPKVYRNVNDMEYCGAVFNFKRKNVFKSQTDKNMDFTRNVSLASKYCCMINKQKFFEIGGFDESFSKTAYVADLSFSAMANGYYNVYTSYANVIAYGDKEKSDADTIKKIKEKWSGQFPYDRYNVKK